MFVEQLAEERVITPPVFGLSELHYQLADLIRDGMSWLTAAVSVGQGSRSMFPQLGLKPIDLPLAEVQEKGRIARGN